MDFSYSFTALILTLHLSLLLFHRAAFGASFTFINKCDYTVWPGILANAGSPPLATTGFELPQDSSRTFTAPTGWSGRFWGRTGCTFSSTTGSCKTGDCGSGQTECNGAGAAPPATLAEFTLGTGGLDFYDVSLVDGYNLPMIVEANGGSGLCASTGCVTDLNRACPNELRVGGGAGCRSACEAFGKPEYCCSGAFSSPQSCRPSVYSEMFKSACPRSYSYAYDDPTSTFTCSAADYTVTFCPSMPSQKSSTEPPPTMTTPTNAGSMTTPTNADGSVTTPTNADGSVTTPTNADGSLSGSETTGVEGTEQGSELGLSGLDPEPDSVSGSQAMLTDETWLAGLAMGDSTRFTCPSAFVTSSIVLILSMI